MLIEFKHSWRHPPTCPRHPIYSQPCVMCEADPINKKLKEMESFEVLEESAIDYPVKIKSEITQDCVLVYCAGYRQPPDSVYLILKDKPVWMSRMLNLPGGKIETGETPMEAAVRELSEETGYSDTSIFEQMGMVVADNIKIYCFKTYLRTYRGQKRDSETESLIWVKWSDVFQDRRLMPNLKVIIPLMQCDVKNWVIDGGSRDFTLEKQTLNIVI